MTAKKWARVKQSGAHGLRRGAWYPVVNDSNEKMVVLDVRKENVPVPRTLVELSDARPTKWSVVKWGESERGAARASEANMGLTYAVCPVCARRARLEPPDAQQMPCQDCGGEYAVDWSSTC